MIGERAGRRAKQQDLPIDTLKTQLPWIDHEILP